jgi:hypothetical protein
MKKKIKIQFQHLYQLSLSQVVKIIDSVERNLFSLLKERLIQHLNTGTMLNS